MVVTKPPQSAHHPLLTSQSQPGPGEELNISLFLFFSWTHWAYRIMRTDLIFENNNNFFMSGNTFLMNDRTFVWYLYE